MPNPALERIQDLLNDNAIQTTALKMPLIKQMIERKRKARGFRAPIIKSHYGSELDDSFIENILAPVLEAKKMDVEIKGLLPFFGDVKTLWSQDVVLRENPMLNNLRYGLTNVIRTNTSTELTISGIQEALSTTPFRTLYEIPDDCVVIAVSYSHDTSVLTEVLPVIIKKFRELEIARFVAWIDIVHSAKRHALTNDWLTSGVLPYSTLPTVCVHEGVMTKWMAIEKDLSIGYGTFMKMNKQGLILDYERQKDSAFSSSLARVCLKSLSRDYEGFERTFEQYDEDYFEKWCIKALTMKAFDTRTHLFDDDVDDYYNDKGSWAYALFVESSSTNLNEESSDKRLTGHGSCWDGATEFVANHQKVVEAANFDCVREDIKMNSYFAVVENETGARKAYGRLELEAVNDTFIEVTLQNEHRNVAADEGHVVAVRRIPGTGHNSWREKLRETNVSSEGYWNGSIENTQMVNGKYKILRGEQIKWR